MQLESQLAAQHSGTLAAELQQQRMVYQQGLKAAQSEMARNQHASEQRFKLAEASLRTESSRALANLREEQAQTIRTLREAMSEIQKPRNQESENEVERRLRDEIRTMMSEHRSAQQDLQDMLAQLQGEMANL